MADGQAFELGDATYPLIAVAAVPVGEEIRCLLAAGWTWDGDKLVNLWHRDVWTVYKRVDSHKIRVEQFDAEIRQAVQEARRREQESGG
jgi:adenylate cyclase